MSESMLGLPLEIVSGGNGYVLDLYKATVPSVNFLWREAARYDFLFSDVTHGDPERFVRYLLSPNVLICLVTQGTEPVGIVYADQLKEALDARVHYLFWDRKHAGRERLLLATMSWFMQTFSFHRLTVEVPVYAFAALKQIHRMGLRIEGRRREAVLYKEKWRDLLLFGVTLDELTDEAIERGKLKRTAEEADWFGVFTSEEVFRVALTKE